VALKDLAETRILDVGGPDFGEIETEGWLKHSSVKKQIDAKSRHSVPCLRPLLDVMIYPSMKWNVFLILENDNTVLTSAPGHDLMK
jgi:hypothetical protein